MEIFFFDMEGYPLYQGGLEYLFGFYSPSIKADNNFIGFEAHSFEEEGLAFKNVINFLKTHLNSYPKANIYFYNHYEVTALKKLSEKHTLDLDDQLFLDNLLNNSEKMIDLFKVVKESILVGEPKYSIKNLEFFFLSGGRNQEVKSAVDSIVQYSNYIVSSDRNIMNQIIKYNEQDCFSTMLLRDWLLELKKYFNIKNDVFVTPNEDTDKLKKKLQKKLQIEKDIKDLILLIKNSRLSELQGLLVNILFFHDRETKAEYVKRKEVENKNNDELLEDDSVITNLKFLHKEGTKKEGIKYIFNFPTQPHKVKRNNKVEDLLDKSNNLLVSEISENSITLETKSSAKYEYLNSLIISSFPNTISIKIFEAIKIIVLKSISGLNYDLVEKILRRKFFEIPQKDMILQSDSLDNKLKKTLNILRDMNNDFLVIQGPPGTGKSFFSSLIIRSLLEKGKKIAVVSNSNNAVDLLLGKITENLFKFKVLRVTGKNKSASHKVSLDILNNSNISKGSIADLDISSYSLVAMTVFSFVKTNLDKIDKFDYIFIDEAGQVPIANALPLALKTEKLVLVGDQAQLSNPVKAFHPYMSGKSILHFITNNKLVISSNHGIFLDTSFRMNKEICKIVSEVFYKNKLFSRPLLKKIAFNNKDLENIFDSNILFVEVDHKGFNTSNEEEANVIKSLYKVLINQSYIEGNTKRKVISDDIIIITPYNAQSVLIKQKIPGAKVGSVDIFQGQESCIVIVSMSKSNMNSKSFDFLMNIERNNVAVSRAKALVIYVIGSNLLNLKINSEDVMSKMNYFLNLYYKSKVLKKSELECYLI